ncbi:PTS transporter subunit EIIC [Carnobacterium gallinarum]|uniref:PTS transporter subunit EIIC n=1 Tax=Carnobacterium gallinarum TaxID=2749 RepID=UPI000557951B|nr:PTS transporter subunit EIIC [Carnobacterium gallinarum]
MAELKEERLAREIYEKVGGMGNVSKIIHCMTRVRMDIREDGLVQLEDLKAIDGVMGVVEDDTLQVIVGPGTVNKVAGKMVEMAGVKLGEPIHVTEAASTSSSKNSGREEAERMAAATKAEQKKKNNTPIKRVLKSISNIFVPMIPAFVGAGIIGGIAAIISNLLLAGDISGDNWVNIVTVLNIIKNGLFVYLQIFVGINAAREFGGTDSLGGIVGGIVYLSGMNPEMPLPNIFTGGDLAAGQGGIIGVIFAVWLIVLLEKRLHKLIPEAIDIIITPTIALLVVGMLTIFLIMPIAGLISSSLVGAINWVLNVGGAFSGFVLGATFLPMVMFGLHQILTPIHIEMISSTGMTLLLPILAMAGAGQVGAAIALWIKCKKNKKLTNMIKGSLPVGILGIGEPLIYGVTLPLGRPFVTACIGGGIGGAVIGAIGGIGSIAIGPSGVALVPLIADGKWMGYILGLLAAYIGGFLATYFFGVPKEAMEATEL